ncbi:folate-binding protein [Altererythrobacter aurantiacus]|uniref:Folate-binding protein n=1 Tax=Parapontixanthobacter aurantiacus TaxID=1463599 RepID=A0A844ZBJ8_9SPHN|nr:folate-binding protein YgfZ [Parapontixanthobacter aurantiacus]MXO84884.1 folate-binding protein [Parapontixanthobacter aurantiacus]
MASPRLKSRAIIRLSPQDDGEDVRAFLQGLVTSDVTRDLPVWAGLLSPQGKAMFDFIVWPSGESEILLDCEQSVADDLVERLSVYRLRRKIAIERDDKAGVFWQKQLGDGAAPDPRLTGLGERWIAPVSPDDEAVDAEWLEHRLRLGVPEGRDELGDILWLETNAAELNGVSFSKGCFIGQENTARMNWRQKVNRRLVVVRLDASDEKRRVTSYPELGFAVDHLKVADIDRSILPEWQAEALVKQDEASAQD